MFQTAAPAQWLRRYALPAGYCALLASLALDFGVNQTRTFALIVVLALLAVDANLRQRLFSSSQLRLTFCFPVIAAAAWAMTPYGESGLKTFDWVVCFAIGYLTAIVLERKAVLLLVLLPALCAAASGAAALWEFFSTGGVNDLFLGSVKLKMYVDHPNRYGLLVATSAAVLIGIVPLLSGRKRLLLHPLLAVLVLLCWYSQSRGAVFSLALTLGIALLLMYKHAPRQALGIFVVTACIFGLGVLLGGERIIPTITKHSSAFLLNDRDDIWQAAWEIFQKSPLAGFGVDSFRQTLEAHLNLPENATRFASIRQQYIFWNAHQIILGILVETGLAGLLLFLALSVRAVYSGIKKYPLALAPLLVFILYWIYGIGAYGFHRSWNSAVFFMVMGLIDGLPLPGRGNANGADPALHPGAARACCRKAEPPGADA